MYIDNQIIIAIIPASSAIIVAAASYFLSNRYKRQFEWSEKKLKHYQELLNALSDLATDGIDKNKANIDFARSSNTIALVASQGVILSLMEFHDEVKFSNKNRTVEKHDLLLKKLLLEIRKDLGLSKKDRENTFKFHLIGSGPK